MTDQDWLAQRFEQDRRRLRAVAYRMLGSVSEADDASRAGVAEHAALARGAPRGTADPALSRSDRGPRRGGRSRTRGAAGRLGRAGAARRARDAEPARAAG